MFTRIKHYHILREIGGGGFATVYLARDENLKRNVAIKVMHAGLARDDEFRRFFEREARLVASLERMAVVPIYDYGEVEGQLYLVMSYMPGGTLAERLEKGNKVLRLTEVIHYGVTAALETQASINAGSLGGGTYYWSVAVVDNGGATMVVAEAPARHFTIEVEASSDPNPIPTHPL